MLTFGVVLNLLCIAIFKYLNFLLVTLAGTWQLPLHTMSLLVPLGISFITFEHISYLLDIRKGNARLYPLMQYAAYIGFFPHLISGPIVRHYELMPQLQALDSKAVNYKEIAQGIMLFVFGLVKKVLIADQIAPVTDTLFSQAAGIKTLSFIEAWFSCLSFGTQIYFDFSGYTDMAMGLAFMMGLTLPDNFNAPYKSTSIRDFWRRWHMTLSRLLRDYLYIPLGGNRHGLKIQITAIMITMLLCGLWHGAGWMFVLWGGWHGLLLAINALWNNKIKSKLPEVLGWFITFLSVMAGWVLFRSGNWHTASTILSAMAGHTNSWLALDNVKTSDIIIVLTGLSISIFGHTTLEWVRTYFVPKQIYSYSTALMLVYILLEIGKGKPSDFIYFQF